MSLLKPASNQTAYLKAGIYGFGGSGKTFTGSHMAVGLAKLSNKTNPKVAFFDTEKGSDFLVKYFQEQGVQLDVVKSRSFADLCAFMQEAEQGKYDVAMIDSVSHIWRELTDSYQKRMRRTNGLLFQDWAKIKGEWQRFTDMFINSKMHTIVLGRAGYEYEFDTDESGKKELNKTGTKMKAEGEFSYESDILLEMERVKDGKNFINRCYVLKDRTDTMNGKTIDFPTFDTFKTVIAQLNVSGEHKGVDTTRTSEQMFDDPDKSWAKEKEMRDIALEEVKQEFILNDLNGTGQAIVKRRTELLIEAFGTSAWSAIEGMQSKDIRSGIIRIRQIIGEERSRELAEKNDVKS
jgi:KaiC/GvpD/RAD55 family RecA-like ATPase